MEANPTPGTGNPPPGLPSLCLSLADHAPLPMVAVEGASHLVRYVNPAFCRLTDKPQEQLLGKSFCEILPEKAKCRPLLDRVFRTGNPESHTEEAHSKTHPVVWSYTMWPVMTDERPVGVMIQVTETARFHETTLAMNEALMVGAVRQHELTQAANSSNALLRVEISEHKQVEEALRKHQQQYDHLVSRIPVAIYISHSTPGEAFALDYVSPRMAEMFNASAESMLANPGILFRSIHPDDLNALLKLNQEGIQNERPLDWMGRVLAEEKVKWLHVVSSPEPLENGDVLWHGLVTDITERKQAEADKEELEATNRQLQKAESLGRMAGAIAHTFNNQLAAVMGNLELVLMDLPKGAGPANSLTAAMEAAGKAAVVSGQMLTYLGQSFGKREPLDLSEACLRSLPILRAGMPGKVVLETHLPSPGPVIRANVNQIQQVLTHLITNAWESLGENGGSIHLGIKTVSREDIPVAQCYPVPWQPQDQAYACLELADPGCGIAAKDIDSLFDPFFSSKFTGRGMGLALVTGIVGAHGGAVTVESEPGRGSTFRVFLPISAEAVPLPPEKASPPLVLDRGGAVLLVEDEAMVRAVASTLLARLGFTVLEARDGVEAIEVFRRHQEEIRCVLCDLTMPRLNGWETLTALRKLAPGVPVILASGYDQAQVMSGDHPEWPQVFLGKPYSGKGLSNAISQALSQPR